MKRDEGRKIDLDLLARTFLSDRDTRTIDRRREVEFADRAACVRINASGRGELTLVGDGGSVLLKSHSLPVVARRHRVSTVIEKGVGSCSSGHYDRLSPRSVRHGAYVDSLQIKIAYAWWLVVTRLL